MYLCVVFPVELRKVGCATVQGNPDGALNLVPASISQAVYELLREVGFLFFSLEQSIYRSNTLAHS